MTDNLFKRVPALFTALFVVSGPCLAETVARNTWVDTPAGFINGNVREQIPGMSCLMHKDVPVIKASDGVFVYAPPAVTYGSECPMGIPVPKGAVDDR